MSKLYFFYGCMGSSKTAQALMMGYNFQDQGKKVYFVKPSLDTREIHSIMRSRIGLQADCYIWSPDMYLHNLFGLNEAFPELDPDVIIVDEAQFLTRQQVDWLEHTAHAAFPAQVFCFGLRTNFRRELFEGSKRLLEIADKIKEIKTMCICGQKAKYNARFDADGRVLTEGPDILIGGDNTYKALCGSCYEVFQGHSIYDHYPRLRERFQ